MKGKIKKITAGIFAAIMVLTSIVSAADTQNILDLPDDWSTDALIWSVDSDIADLYQSLIFPDTLLTRAEIADIVVRYAGVDVEPMDLTPFYTDVDKDAWYYSAVAKGFRLGVIEGYAGLMRPLDYVTREEAFTMLGRILGLEDVERDSEVLQAFGDVNDISDWAVGKLGALVEAGFVLGDGVNLNPKALISKKEFITVLYRYDRARKAAEEEKLKEEEKEKPKDKPKDTTPPPIFIPPNVLFTYYHFNIKSNVGIVHSESGIGRNEKNISVSIPSTIQDSTELGRITLEVSTADGTAKRVSRFGMEVRDRATYTGQELFNQLAEIAEDWSRYVEIEIPIMPIDKDNGTVGDLRNLYQLVYTVYTNTYSTRPEIWDNDLGITMHSPTKATVIYNILDSSGNVIARDVSITLDVAK